MVRANGDAVQIRVLGPFEVVAADGAVLAVRGAQRRLLLATLVLRRNALCGTGQLIDVLFGDDPPPRAFGTVQSYVSRLRRDLGEMGDRLQTRPGGYTLMLADGELDSAGFEVRVAAGLAVSESDPVHAAQLLDDGLGWWGGDRAFSEFPDDPALYAESVRLDEVHQQAAGVLAGARITLGDHAGAIDVLERCSAAWPLREGFRSQLMLVLHRSGRQPEALRACRRFRRELAELGLVPSPALADLETRILHQDPSLMSPPAGPGRAAANHGDRVGTSRQPPARRDAAARPGQRTGDADRAPLRDDSPADALRSGRGRQDAAGSGRGRPGSADPSRRSVAL